MIKIGFWNVNGLNLEKSKDAKFKELVNTYDIICLTETWGGEKSKINTPTGYKAIYHNRKKKHKDAKRNSGGILILYKHYLHKHLSIKNNKSQNILWVAIDKKLLGIERNLLVGAVYISPINSSIYNREDNINCDDIFDELNEQIASFNENDIILLGGDFNARTGNLKDFIENVDNEDKFLPFSEYFDEETPFSKVRVNQDKIINRFGHELRDLCIGTKLKILNGRTLGDLMGKYTCIKNKGCSTVDYVLASKNIMMEQHRYTVTDFKVEDLNILSDHRPLTVSLHNFEIKKEENVSNVLLENSSKREKTICKKKFKDFVETDCNFKISIKNIKSNLDQSKGSNIIDKTVKDIEELLGKVDNITKSVEGKHKELKTISKGVRNKKKYRGQKWFNSDCRKLKRQFNHVCKKLNKDPNNACLRNSYYSIRKEYKKLVKSSKRKFEEEQINELENNSKNRNLFWKLLKETRGKKEDSLPDPEELQNHFCLLYKQQGTHNSNNIKLEEIIQTKEGELLGAITIDEIKEKIKKAKGKKSSGYDRISNEILKNSTEEMFEIYKLLFNKIIETEKYPESWNTSLTQLIHKDGSREDSTNFRGVSLTSNLAKIFNSIINDRLRIYLEDNNLIALQQGGFRKGYRTVDHIFVLQTVIKKYLKDGKRLYACFVDLEKAFDSVWRDGLFMQLKKIGLDQKTINVISSMYKNTSTSLIYHDKVLPKIPTTKAVKQGDNLSPLLFNIFINDLPKFIKDDNTHPVQLNDCEINSLMWADDIVLLSESKEGLQKCLDNLNNFCKDLKLKVNLKKTKALIFNKYGKTLKSDKFYIDSRIVENVNKYTYLGFTIAASGKFHMGIQRLIDRGQRAWFSILQILNKSKHKNIETYITIFDNIIKQILLYACEIWGIQTFNGNINEIGKSAVERFHLKICKRLLGVHRKASNLPVLMELGRYPLYIEIEERIIKYLLRFKSLKGDRLVSRAYKEQIDRISENDNWLSRVRDIINRNGFSYVFINQMDPKHYIDERNIIEISKNIKKRSKDIFEQSIIHYIQNNEGKLIFYSNFKNRFMKENYLNLRNTEYRKIICKIRISAHNLRIETGRYQNIERKSRFCEICKLNEIESEEHFLFKCTMYEENRKFFYNELKWIYGLDLEIQGIEGLKTIFNSEDLELLKKLGKFMMHCWTKRKIEYQKLNETENEINQYEN